MPLENFPPPEVLAELKRLEAAQPTSEAEVYDALHALARSAGASDEVRESATRRAESTAFAFDAASTDTNVDWGTYYGPMMSGVTADGSVNAFPDLAEVTPEVLAYWAERAAETPSPLMRLRYLDLQWDLARPVRGATTDVGVARGLVDTTLELFSSRLIDHPAGMVEKLRRALDVALRIRDQARVATVRDALLEYDSEIAASPDATEWGFAFDALVGAKGVTLDPKDESRLVSDLEARLDLYSTGADAAPHGAEQVAERLARYYRRVGNREKALAAIRRHGAAYERAAESVAPLVAAAYLRKALEIYTKNGMTDEAARLGPRLRERGARAVEEMKPLEVEISIPAAKIEGMMARLMGDTLESTFDRITAEFIPVDREAALAAVREQAKHAPFQTLLDRHLLDGEGRVTAVIGPLAVDPDGHVAKYLGDYLRFCSPLLRIALDRARTEWAPTADQIMAYLRRAPVFVSSRNDLLEEGMAAYLRGEHAHATHVLLPQVEAAVRQVLVLTDRPLVRRLKNGGTLLRALDEMLRDETVESVLGERVCLYLRVVLTDARGWNLRNDVCHGLTPAGAFDRMLSDRVLHVLLILAQVRLARAGAVANEGAG